MDPSLYYLRTFQAVATEHSFTRAGRRLGLSQPAVSAHIRALEQHFGAELFEVRQRSVHLTAAGQALFTYTQRAFNLLDEAALAVAAARHAQSGVLRMGASPIVGIYLLPPLLGKLKHERPDVQIDVAITTSGEVVRQVVGEAVPFGIVEAPVSHRDVDVQPIGQDEMVLVAPPQHALARIARHHPVQPEQLEGIPVLRREAGSGTRALVDTALSRVGLNAPTLMELGSPEALKQAVLQGVGIAWVSRLSVARELAAHELELVSVVGLSVPRVLSLVHRRDTVLPALAEPLLELIHSTTADSEAQPY